MAAITFLDLLRPADREALVARGATRVYAEGEVLLAAGDDSEIVLVIRSGRVKVLAHHEDGTDLLLAVRGAGELLGELAALSGYEHAATVVALERTTCTVIDGAAFLAELSARPGAGIALARSIVMRLYRSDGLLRELSGRDVLQRVCGRLLELSEDHGEAVEEGVAINLGLSHEDLAAMIGATRESANRALQELRRRGWIAVERRRIVVLDAPALRSVRR